MYREYNFVYNCLWKIFYFKLQNFSTESHLRITCATETEQIQNQHKGIYKVQE